MNCVQTLDDDLPCGVAEDDHEGMNHPFRAPSPEVVEFSKSMPCSGPEAA